MKICIIGSSGFIGSYLYSKLDTEFEIKGYDIKETKYSDYIMSGKEVDPSCYDVVIYLAGITTRVMCKSINYDVVFEYNITDIMTLAQKMNSNQLLIYASTAGIFEGCTEEEATEERPINVDLLDQYTRSMYERECNIKKLTNTNTIGLRFGSVMGVSPTQRTDLCYISMVKSALLNGEINVQYQECKRSILWNNDLLRVIKTIIRNKNVIVGNYCYNISSFNTSIHNVGLDVSKKTNIPLKISLPLRKNTGFKMSTNAFCTDYNFTFEGTSDIIINELKENIYYLCGEHGTLETLCRVCKSSNMLTLLDLGMQPLANNYLTTPQIQQSYPLCIIRCSDCKHTQLNYTVFPEVLFRNYQYESSTSYTLREYFLHLADKCIKESGKTIGKVLELACNDGSQLDEFKKHGWDTYGVDPAINLVSGAIERGHKIIPGFWGKDDIVLPKMDIVVAQNVLAHVPDPVLFLSSCVNVMNEDTFLYIQTSQCNMYVNGEFDTTYHEHLSYFTISSMMRCAELSGLCIVDIEKPSIHGVSYLFTMKRKTDLVTNHSEKVFEEYNKENQIGLYGDSFYSEYREKVENIKEWVNEKITNYNNNSIKVIAYGAAAKGMTLLNYCNVDGISYIVDDSSLKHNKYTPGKNIQIYPIEQLTKETGEICLFVLAWNFLEEIEKKIRIFISNTSITKVHIMTAFPTPCINTIYNIKSILITHVYNEEYLLPFWLTHHKGMFDHLIIIDHRCTDNSLQICIDLWPTCIILKSSTSCFDARETDEEVMEIERKINGIKLVLNTTEFLFAKCSSPFDKEYANNKIKELFFNSTNNIIFSYGIKSYSPYSNNWYEVETNLDLYKNMLNSDFRFQIDRTCRYIHTYNDGFYKLGRHETLHPHSYTSDLLIVWLGYYPMNEKLIKRKIQIGQWQSVRDIIIGAGSQHQTNKEKILEILNDKTLNGVSLQETCMDLYNLLNELH
jgi:nucleoside-diphosphate-sugar epimerase/SAM-dependent methyltransferase